MTVCLSAREAVKLTTRILPAGCHAKVDASASQDLCKEEMVNVFALRIVLNQVKKTFVS